MSKSTKKKKAPSLVRTRGMGLSVKLFRCSGLKLSAPQLTSALKKIKYSPKSRKDAATGFTRVSASGRTVTADLVAGFRVPVLGFDKDGNLTPVHYVSVDKGQVFVKTGKGTVEVRGSERIARRFKSLMEETTGAKLTPLNLNGGTRIIYDAAADIASVLLTGVEKGNLTQAEFRGIGIQNEDEIGLYTRRYKGEITRFRGTFPYPSGAFLTTSVNAEAGSLMIYRTGEGIYEKDLNWIVELMENAALAQG
ncbi:MAG: hypothetical protein AM324_013250 [Candidatus Thorarchaeota archaeon SMTZ1-83]|nr:MAG: hypothetical protein AM324_14390 [Candidatus Thorarchaeota archaeon SMTZ1-83]